MIKILKIKDTTYTTEKKRNRTMHITVNGENKEFDTSSLPITTLLEVAKVESPDMVSVQVNGKVIDRTLYADTLLRDNDEVDFLYFMGGGA